ncbi:hypothetical protein QVA73_06345 [Staphylococcus chromogenes]|uniref:hypothetical protein n=1 Tax=Staphylococcus chromogenes TaxID=46126 RepID=UPI002901AF01|nr:hypothetical protein [Staphylococcus chromogenes]MDU0476511.1 hypothetical protein [Staphylococcus chromogenes]
MVKIKTKKKMTLPQLIQWGWDNPRLVEGKWIKPKDTTLEGVYFSKLNRVIVRDFVYKDDTFTVEIEEEITADTVITNLVEVYEYNEIMESVARGECSITNALGEEVDDVSRLAFYMLNDDMTMTLIWRNGGMVE